MFIKTLLETWHFTKEQITTIPDWMQPKIDACLTYWARREAVEFLVSDGEGHLQFLKKF